jgi:hypothetical protein
LAHDLVHQLQVGFEACVAPEQPTVEVIFADLGLAAQQERILEEFRQELEVLRSFF